MYVRYEHITDYLKEFRKPFTVIAITETWCKMERGTNFDIDGYEFRYVNRKNKRSRGVALYIRNTIDWYVLENMTMIIDDVMECLSVEIYMENQKNVIVSCVYRTPGSSMEIFNNSLESMFASNNQKLMFICGDFNVNLLKVNKDKMVDEFIETVQYESLSADHKTKQNYSKK